MRLVSILIVAGALVIAAGIFLIVPRFLGGGQPAQQVVVQVPTKNVLVAAHVLPAGTVLKGEDVKFQKWPQEAVDPAYFVQEKGDDPQRVAVGMMVLHGIDPGEPITAARLMKPGEAGFLAAALKPGMRGVAIKVDLNSAVAGFISPGDRVDILLVEKFNLTYAPKINEVMQYLPHFNEKEVSSVVLSDVKVLAINQAMQDTDSKPSPNVADATVEVSIEDAQKLSVASNLGSLQLVLRSRVKPDSGDEDDAQGDIVDDTQSVPYHAETSREAQALLSALVKQSGGGMRLYRGGQLANPQQPPQ